VKARWLSGHRARLLENGEQYFPRVFECIAAARREVIVETFILFEDKVGNELQARLIDAARRGVSVDLLVDGYGSADLGPAFIGALVSAGVRLRLFDPGKRLFGQRINLLRRMHRKLVVIDGERAFVGGINFSADHLADFGAMAKQDYAVELQGPIVETIRRFALSVIEQQDHAAQPRRTEPTPQALAEPPHDGRRALFVTRDNHRHHNRIERHYRLAIRRAKKRVIIANAYFFPGYRLLRQISRAAQRGVDVRLILQGEPDMPIVKTAASMLYEHLQRHGVKVYEYCKRPLHGKVAVVDDDWATIGSSNLDPLSLTLNLEANVILQDAAFAGQLRERLEYLVEHECRLVPAQPKPKWAWWWQLRTTLLFHFLRRFPGWARQLPQHAPRLVLPDAAAEAAPKDSSAAHPPPLDLTPGIAPTDGAHAR
jgi:cardiolipin synthase